MGRRSIAYKIIPMVFTVVMATPALAAPYTPPQPFVLQGKYDVSFNGITIGRIRLNVEETAHTYTISIDTKTHGVGALFSQEKRIATAHGSLQRGMHIPATFESFPQKDPEGNRAELAFDAKGNVATISRIPAEDPAWRPPVSAEEAKGALDPASGGLLMRRKLHAALAEGERTVATTTFDGARLATMTLTEIKPEARVEIMGTYVPAVNTLVTRQPLKGYTAKELKKFNGGDPEIHLYFTADEAFIPVMATVNTTFGQLSATLTEKE